MRSPSEGEGLRIGNVDGLNLKQTMKHFTITSDTEAAALRPFASEPLKVGHIVTPSVGSVTHTAWEDYPEADAMTFDECMAIVRDEVTEDVMRDIGSPFIRAKHGYFAQIDDMCHIAFYISTGKVELVTMNRHCNVSGIIIPNPTATKIKLLAAILRGEKI
jgi:hypothetical protein